MTVTAGYIGIEPKKDEWTSHPCTKCFNSKRCAEEQLGCSIFRAFLNPKISSPTDNRVPTKELFV